MRTKLGSTALLITLLSLFLVVPATAGNINKSVRIEPGSEVGGSSSVNGSISVGEGATVTGSLDTVNGTIRIDDDAVIRDTETVNGSVKIGSGVKAESVSSVNGTVQIGERATITGEVSVVNGRIDIGSGSSVSQDVSNVNGQMTISGAEIGGNLSTVNGDVTLDEAAVLKGDLTVKKPHDLGRRGSTRKPRIIIGPGSKVLGQIVAERAIELYISDTAEVGGVSGTMSLDQAVRFSGKRP